MDNPGHAPRYSVSVAFRLIILIIFVVIPLQAYTDPGSGMLFWQVAGAFFMGVVYQVRKFFGRNREKK